MTICSHPQCKKKINLMKFTCKCQLDFCIKHMAPETHNCTYNFKIIENLQEKIEQTKCIPEKIKSI